MRDPFLSGVAEVAATSLFKILRLYIQLYERPIRRLLAYFGKNHLADLMFPPSSIDDRIAKLDAARSNIVETLEAIDELKLVAAQNKKELDAALQQLAKLEETKEKSQRELNEIKKIAGADIHSFQKLAGITPRDRWVERFIGFVAGFVASTVSALVLYPFLS